MFQVPFELCEPAYPNTTTAIHWVLLSTGASICRPAWPQNIGHAQALEHGAQVEHDHANTHICPTEDLT